MNHLPPSNCTAAGVGSTCLTGYGSRTGGAG